MKTEFSRSDFEGYGIPTIVAGKDDPRGETIISEAMKILENPGVYNRKLDPTMVPDKVVSRTYDLSDPKQVKKYQNDVLNILKAEPGSLLLLDRRPKQFVQTGDSYRYVAYLEWVEYVHRSDK